MIIVKQRIHKNFMFSCWYKAYTYLLLGCLGGILQGAQPIQKDNKLIHADNSHYQYLDTQAMKHLFLHPFELENSHPRILEMLVGFFFANFLLFQDIKAVADPMQYPHLEDVIYSDCPTCIRKHSYYHRCLQFKNYLLITLGGLAVILLGNIKLAIGLASFVLSSLLAEIALISGLHYILASFIGSIPLILGGWSIFVLITEEEAREKVEKIINYLKNKKYWLATGVFLILLINYLLVTFARANIRVKAHKQRKELANQKRNSIQKNIRNLEGNLGILKEEASKLEKACRVLKACNEKKENKCQEIREELTKKEQELTSLKERHNQQKDQCNKVTEEIVIKKEELNRLTNSIEELTIKINEINNQKKSLSQNYQSLQFQTENQNIPNNPINKHRSTTSRIEGEINRNNNNGNNIEYPKVEKDNLGPSNIPLSTNSAYG